jgi:hypothetical protein
MTLVTDEQLTASRDSHAVTTARAHPHLDSIRRRMLSEGGLVFCLSAGLYLVCGAILAFHYHSFFGDAVSRMANGFYVLYSRDPHLAAIGFVWNPLQSVADIVPLLFYHLWPALATRDMAGTIVSSLCMAGATYQLLAAFREWGLRRGPRFVLAGLFALNPMIIFYGANGMSEALYLFTLVAVCRYLARWLRDDDLRSLAFAAVALGLCYLVRNEAVAPAATAGTLVFIVSMRRARRARVMHGLTDLAVFLFPFVTSFAAWAVVSDVITGSPFEQFSSVYGTTAQIQAGGGGPVHLGPALRLEGEALLYLAPLLTVVAVLAVVFSVRRRDTLILAPVMVIASGLAFDLAAYVSGGIIWSFRYFIAAVPLDVMLLGIVLAAAPSHLPDEIPATRESLRQPARAGRGGGWARLGPAAALTALAFVLLAPSLPATAAGMFNPRVGYEETRLLGFVVHSKLSRTDRGYSQNFQWSQDLSSYIAGLGLPTGDVVVDNSSPCIPAAIVISPNPRVFVIPNDRDFQRILADPITFHTRYILVPPPVGQGTLTATDRLYPALYSSGEDTSGQRFATLAHTFADRGGACPEFRLYRVTRHSSAPV